jgi:15-cis-phytoene synthase
MTDPRLEQSYAACRTIMRENASTFSLASRLLPRDRRRATFALYGLFRTLDDLVDETDSGTLARDQALAELARWRAWLRSPETVPPEHPLVPAFRDTVERYAIPLRYFVELIDGLEGDVANRRYATFGELALYCYRVAATVGLAMCRVLGVIDERASSHAVELGVAMQLTNILRDVQEDLEHGRVYLPQDELAAAGWDEERLRGGRIDAAFRALIQRQATRARSYYDRGIAGLPYLTADARLAILVAARAYGAILTEIERRKYDVFAGRARVSWPRKFQILAVCYVTRRRYDRRPQPAIALAPGEPTGAELLLAASGLVGGG